MYDCIKTGWKNNIPTISKFTILFQKKRLELVVILLYFVALTTISIFHEPWFDEAQAWQIAKCASLKDILLTIPRFEGHPPLWHLILFVPAKLGIPYEIGIKTINIIICTWASGLLIFHAPFPKIIRMLMPFTFFLFYQYGVISRPYSIMYLAFIIAAMSYDKKDTKPIRFVLALMLLCLSNAYGIVISFGISVVWIIEMLREQKVTVFIKSMFRDKRIWSLIFLLLFAGLITWMIIPSPDAFAIQRTDIGNDSLVYLLLRAVYMIFVLPADTCLICCFNEHSELLRLPFNANSFILGIVLGLIIWYILITFARMKKTTLLLVVPFLLFAIFGAMVYFYRHHIGIAFLFLLFWAWVSNNNKEYDKNKLPGWLLEAMKTNSRLGANLVLIFRGFCALIIIVPVIWSASAAYHEIGINYGYGREVAHFIKDNGLQKLNIMASWRNSEKLKTREIPMNTSLLIEGTSLLPYFDTNIIYNLNNGEDLLAYMTLIVPNEETNKKNIESWKSHGIPDLLIGDVDIKTVYGNEVSFDDYVPVYEATTSKIWKTFVTESNSYIYLRRDLLSHYDLTEITES